MKVFRFMSLLELGKYLNEEKLTNNTEHSNGNKTNSKGFCFLSLGQYKPEEALHFLFGAIKFPEVCAIFEVDRKELIKSYGIYAKPVKAEENTNERLQKALNGTIEKIKATEYCATEYSKANFNLIEVAKPNWFNREKWNWICIEEEL